MPQEDEDEEDSEESGVEKSHLGKNWIDTVPEFIGSLERVIRHRTYEFSE